jgi:hypothetical protein
MRGRKQAQRQFVAMIDVNARIPQGHPIREIKRVSNEVFGRLGERFEAMYSGRRGVSQFRKMAEFGRIEGRKILPKVSVLT